MWLLIGWIVTMIAFAVAVDYTCAQINEIGQCVSDLKTDSHSLEQTAERSVAFDRESLSKDLEAIHKILAGGFAALLAEGSTGDDGFSTLFEAADRVDVAKLMWEKPAKSTDQH